MKHSLIALFCTVVLSTAMFFGGSALVVLHQTDLTTATSSASQTAAAIFPLMKSQPTLLAKAAILYDPSDGRVLYAKNADEQLPLASITKLMTSEIVLNEESPNTMVTITPEGLAPEGDWGFKVGDVLPLSDLLRFGLIASSNDAMQAAAISLGPNYIDRMNEVAKNLNLTETNFTNPTGLDVNANVSGAYSSPYDVARLAALFYTQYPSFFELTQQSSVSINDNGRTLTAQATDLPLLDIPGLIGAKTGYTDLAGGNLVAIFDIEIGHPLVAVVLGSTEDGRFTDIRSIINAARGN